MRRTALAATAAIFIAVPAAAQQPAGEPELDSARVRRGAAVLIPAASFLLPGLGQYMYGAPAAGLAHTATTVAGLVIVGSSEPVVDDDDAPPRRGRDQLLDQVEHVAMTSAMLSSWDAFQRALPGLQQQGKYTFLGERERLGDLLSAPFDVRFLSRWTTWVDLAQTATVTVLILAERSPGESYHRVRGQDVLWGGSMALNAAVGEEAAFRGWLLPILHERTGERFWLANGIQGTLFAAAHPDAKAMAIYIGAWSMWEGWVTRRNGWSVRESVFHHFWFNTAVSIAAFASTERDRPLRLSFPTVSF